MVYLQMILQCPMIWSMVLTVAAPTYVIRVVIFPAVFDDCDSYHASCRVVATHLIQQI
jgi:hypothetical protein